MAAGYTSPTARRRRLGVELRLLREKAGLTGEEAAARMSWSGSKLSRIERGQVSSNSDDIRDLLELYGVTDPSIRQALILLARESRRRGWWHVYGDVIPERFDVYLGLEPEACTLRFYHGQLVPGLLQTREYALSLLETHAVPVEPHEISRRLELRMRRQQILAREDPPHVWAVLDEAVVHRVIGGPAVMADQLRHLIRMSELPHITVQVLPFGRGAHPGVPAQRLQPGELRLDRRPRVVAEPVHPQDRGPLRVPGQAGGQAVHPEGGVLRHVDERHPGVRRGAVPGERAARHLLDPVEHLPPRRFRDGKPGAVFGFVKIAAEVEVRPAVCSSGGIVHFDMERPQGCGGVEAVVGGGEALTPCGHDFSPLGTVKPPEAFESSDR